MDNSLTVYNTITRKKEKFEPINPPFVGLYVCGPTVYSDSHLGHARAYITFDVVFRYLKYAGYKVRFVRNITDVGHLEGDADQGEDKLAKRAKLEEMEPMEIAQLYMNSFHEDMDRLNVSHPSIEPRATGHIPEQINMIQKILENGFAYEANGSVYFDVEKYNQEHAYGELSGRVIEDLLSGSRKLEKQDEKKSPLDFSIWKRAEPEHLMRWDSPWGEGFPGWHLECSVMSTKYLGEQFDIHGGGMDLLFPHHECEIAQSVASGKIKPAKYWLHNNLITLDGQKMGKSLGNAISLKEFFSGDHDLLECAYSPMVIRFFILQAQYRSTLDFSNEALQAAEKGYLKLIASYNTLKELNPADQSVVKVEELKNKCLAAMNDDFNTPILIAHLFDVVKIINSAKDGQEKLTREDMSALQAIYDDFMIEILGLLPEIDKNDNGLPVDGLMNIILELRKKARENKDFETSDIIRDELARLKFVVKDGKGGTSWDYNG